MPNNLPGQRTSFIGREQETAEVRRLLAASRLVTLTGAGGCGKSRLAREVAAGLLAESPDGVGWVELASVIEPFLVPCLVAQALGVPEQPGRPLLETPIDHFSARKMLLVLDGANPLPSDVADLAGALLEGPSQLRILVTSREPLGAVDEAVWPVPPLSLPDEAAAAGSASDAVRLFVERAAAALPAFALTEVNAPRVAALCRLLDGSPLAIELAAAPVRDLPLEAIAAGLEAHCRRIAHHAEARGHEPIVRAALDWRCSLLSVPEARLLQRLSVFRGGWTLEAARAVCARGGVPKHRVPDLLGRLEEKSLVSETAEPPRYSMPEAIREYTWQEGLNSGERRLLQRLHREWFLDLAERACKGRSDADEAAGLALLEEELENLRAAVRFSLEQHDITASLRLGAALWRFWHATGRVAEGRARLWDTLRLVRGTPPADIKRLSRRLLTRGLVWLLALLGFGAALVLLQLLEIHGIAGFWLQAWDSPALPWVLLLLLLLSFGVTFADVRSRRTRAKAHARVLHGAGVLALAQGEEVVAMWLFRESLAIWQRLDSRGEAEVIAAMGHLALQHGDYRTARSLFDRSLATWRAWRSKAGIAEGLANLGLVLHHEEAYDKPDRARSLIEEGNAAWRKDDFATARARYEESMALWQELNNRWGIASTLHGLGNIALHQGDYAAARARYEESAQVRRGLGDRTGGPEALNGLANVAYCEGDLEVARPLFEQSLAIWREQGSPAFVAYSLLGLGLVAAHEGDLKSARRCVRGAFRHSRRGRDARGVIYALGILGRLAIRQQRYQQARALLRKSLTASARSEEQDAQLTSLEGLAEATAQSGRPGHAARLWGAAEARREAIGAPLPPVDRADYDRAAAAARADLGEVAFTAAWAEGRALTLEQAVAEALKEGDHADR